MSRAGEQPPHRLFAAIVLMGSGLAVGCGGVAEGGHQASAGGASSGSSSGGSGGAPTAPVTGAGSGTVAGSGIAIGGATSTGSSGSANGVAGLNIGFAGAPPEEPSPVDPGPFACPPQQWSCQAPSCYDGGGYKLPDECPCDPKRPLTANDCQPGEVFVCQRATRTKDDRPLTHDVMLACLCAPKSDCFAECAAYDSRPRVSCQDSQDELSAWCGCAVTLLK